MCFIIHTLGQLVVSQNITKNILTEFSSIAGKIGHSKIKRYKTIKSIRKDDIIFRK